MSDIDDKETEKTETPPSTETGTMNLLAGAGLGTYATTVAVTTSYICPVCVVAAPALLGLGAYQKYKHHKGKEEAEDE